MQSMNHPDQRSAGQALTEFALVVPLFFLLIFGVIQMGIIFGGQIALGNTAREVARYASTVPVNSGAQAESQARSIMARSIPGYNGSGVPVVTYCYYPDATNGTYSYKVIVSITYGHTLFVPLVGAVLGGGNHFNVSVQEEMRVETQPIKNPSGTACGVSNP